MLKWLPDPARIDIESRGNVGRAAMVTVTLFALVVVAPVTVGRALGTNLLGSAALGALVILAGRTRRALLIAILLGGPALVLRWFVPDADTGVLRLVSFLLAFFFEVFVLIVMLRHIFTADRVGPVTLLMAVNSYLLLGLIFSGFFILVEAFQPGSFRGLATGRPEAVVDLYYFSYVTLTTLGYGDITPTAPLARSLVLAEVICGVMFTGVLVARLIGLYSEHGRNRD